MTTESSTKPNPNQTYEPPKFRLDVQRPHSKFCEYVLRILRIAIAFMRFALQKSPILPQLCLERLQVKSGNFLNPQSLKGSEADVVYSIPLKSEDGTEEQEIIVYTLIEHKSTNDYNAICQLARYYSQLLFFENLETNPAESKDDNTSSENSSDYVKPKKKTKKLPLVIPILFHHGAEPYTGPTSLKEFFPQVKGFERLLLNFEPIIIDLSKIKLENIPHDPNEKAFHAVMTIIKLVFQEERFEDVEKSFLELFPEAQNDPQYMDLVRATIQYFWVASHTDRSRFYKLVENHYPQEIEEGESTMLSLLEESHLKGVKEGEIRGLEKGLKRGREEGIEEGLERGQILKARYAVLTILKTRFQTVPSTVKNRIGAIADEIVLNSLLVEATMCQSMDEFEQSL